MSRIGKKPISIPKGVTVAIHDRELEVKGAKGVLRTPIPEGITFKQENDELVAARGSNEQAALHGLARALANNAIKGVTEGFSTQMDVVGVGYKADVQGRKIVFALGYSHPIEFPLPEGIEAKADAVMMAHVVYPQVAPEPAGYSPRWIQDILRGEMGFRGVVFSDDIGMAAAFSAGGVKARIDAHLDAGCDVVLVCHPDLVDDSLAAVAGRPLNTAALLGLIGRGAMGWDGLIAGSRHGTAQARLSGDVA